MSETLQTLVNLDLVPDEMDADPTTEIGCVVLAVLARERLAANESMTRTQFGGLASVSKQRVAQLVAAGSVREGREGLTPASVRKWLESRTS